MKCYRSKDLISDLQVLVNQDVKHYLTDFNYDKEIFAEAVNEENKDFIWFTRDSGTNCVTERSAFIDGTYGHAECESFMSYEDAKVYYVHIDGMENGKIAGRIYPVDKEKLLEEVFDKKVPAYEVALYPNYPDDKDVIKIPYSDYSKRARYYYDLHKPVKRLYFASPENEIKLNGILREHKEYRENAKEEDISELIGIQKKQSLDACISGAKSELESSKKEVSKGVQKEVMEIE